MASDFSAISETFLFMEAVDIKSANPFNLTAAKDFSDEQIREFWVDMPGGGGLLAMLKPRSLMPMLVLGGKGSGKTHLLRYCSFELQKLKAGKALVPQITQDGFIGVFMRCEGLNANRFSGKGQSDELWNSVFQDYMDLFLADLLLSHISEILAADPGLSRRQTAFCTALRGLFSSGNIPDLFHDSQPD